VWDGAGASVRAELSGWAVLVSFSLIHRPARRLWWWVGAVLGGTRTGRGRARGFARHAVGS
jgi:hypothetical protein